MLVQVSSKQVPFILLHEYLSPLPTAADKQDITRMYNIREGLSWLDLDDETYALFFWWFANFCELDEIEIVLR